MKNVFAGMLFVGLIMLMVHCFAIAIDKEIKNSEMVKALSIDQGIERNYNYE